MTEAEKSSVTNFPVQIEPSLELAAAATCKTADSVELIFKGEKDVCQYESVA